MIKKLGWLLAALFLLGVGFYLIYLYTDFIKSSKNFGVDDIAKIDRITISKDSSMVVLVKGRTGWNIEGEGEVKPMMIERLLYMLQFIDVKAPLPKAMKEAASERLAHGYVVTAESMGKTIKEYTLAEIPGTNFGTFGVLSGKKNVYLLLIPSSNFSPASILSADPAYWHQNLVMSVYPEQIISINVDNIAQPQKSFKIYRSTDGKFHLYNTYKQAEVTAYNEEQMDFYLSLYSNLAYKKMLKMDTLDFKTLLISEPESIITLVAEPESKSTIKLFRIPIGDDYDETGRPLTYDRNNFYLVFSNDSKVAEASWVDFDLLLQDVNFFLKSNQ